ncbi:hypothetical protein ERO13_A01G137900v2 [Gossypium hirsutum]|uniref:Uncharacterized protein isoform X2 n=2 Tax=Gossypium TaxID=3633 RepID=A0A1U8IB49_GOSHI|nr:uncharacterized protein LOC107892925 isoform X2 [Gossypium hirsutum]KAB2097035.1 hypothetical protein ES319_A01G143600v1 [Gossypium barbadense]KAG4214750.1 hypothetical protein ERO13_A01G137900v2 [Gossypium hirsutum]
MESSLLQWESDPLFSAAEVVQDSADRMESFFRLLLHEKTLLQSDLPDPKLLTSIGYHTRDLATVLETAKWQLEDFERAVNSSARMDQSHSREHVISRHKQFIIAIRGEINDVEKSLEDMELGNPMKNSKWGNLNQQDRDGLALFLSGGNHNEHDVGFDLDPVSASCSTDAGIVANGCGEIEEVNTNGVAHSSHYYGSMKENNLRKGQHIGLSSAPGDNSGFLVKVMHLRRRLGACDSRFARFSYLFKLNRRSVQMILTVVFAFMLLGILVSHVT